MKIYKKCVPMLLAALMVMSFLPCLASAAGSWSEVGLTTIDKSDGSSFTPNAGHTADVAVFEWYFDLPEINPSAATTYYGLWEGSGNRWQVVTSSTGTTTFYAQSGSNFESTASPKINTLGGQRIHGLQVVDLTGSDRQLNRRVWINGVEYPNVSKSWMVASGSASLKNVTYGTVAYVNASANPVADFDASRYAAQLTSSDEAVIVGGEKFGSEFALNHTLTLKEKWTVAELKDVLSVSTGASIAVLNAVGLAAQDTDEVGQNFAVQVTSQNGKVIVKYNVVLDLKWPVIPLVFENTDTDGAKEVTIYEDGVITSDNPFPNPEKAYVFNYTYTPTETSTEDATGADTTYAYGAGVTLSVDGGTAGWTPVVFTAGYEDVAAGIYENAPIGGAAGEGANLIEQEHVGETYHVTAVVKQDSADSLIYSKIFINGAELTGGLVYSEFFNQTSGSAQLFVGKGVKGTLSEVDSDVYDNFSTYYESYQAQVTSISDEVIVSADETVDGKPFHNFVIDLTNTEDMTVGGLLASLAVPEGATAAVVLEETSVDEDMFVQSPMELAVTSENGEVTLRYTLIAPIKQIRSTTYKIIDSEAVKTISGILRYTPATEVIDAIECDAAQEIVGFVSADGNPITEENIDEGMCLKIIDSEGEPSLYELILSNSWTEFEDVDGVAQIKDIKGKINGKTTLISGRIDIPSGGISEILGLYFELDNGAPDYVIQFTKEGTIAVWGNEIGNWKRGSSYEYAIVTNPQEGTCDAYINGIKLLDGSSINGSYNGESDPWELVGGSYNPCENGDFLLSEIYSADAFENVYAKSLTELTASGENVSVLIHDADTLEVSIFADESYTVGSLLESLCCAENAVIACLNSTGSEITDPETPVTALAYLMVTSRDERYTARYSITISQDVLRSSEFTVSNSNNTIGTFLQFTPVSALTDSITVRPDWECLGVYREGEPTTDDIIMAGDILRLQKDDVIRDYTLNMQADIANSGSEILIPGNKIENDMVIEGKFTIPENGIYSYNYQHFTTTTGGLLYFFRISHATTVEEYEEYKDKFQILGKVLCTLEPGETYEYTIVHRQSQKLADIYLNGVLLYKNVTSLIDKNTQLEMLERRGTLVQNDQTFRFYEIYSADTFRYEGSIGLTSSSCSISYNPHVINVTSSSVSTVSDLLANLTFPNESVRASAKLYSQGSEISNLSTKLVSGMTLKLTAEGGREAVYRINVAASPVTSYVFDVSDNTISYSGNLSYYDFMRYCILADGCSLKVTTSDGTEVTSGNMESGMKAVVSNKIYTVNLTGTTVLPTISINSIEEDEILLTSDTYTKTITVTGDNITRVAVYFDGEAEVVGSAVGTYTFEKSGLTIGRHEIYAEVVSDSGRVETARYAVFAFDRETDRLRAARRPVVMDIRYLDKNGSVIPESDRVSHTATAQIELVFNKALTESTVNKDNIRLYNGDALVTDYEVSYVTCDEAYYAVIISLGTPLAPSTDYKIVAGSDIADSTGNTAGDDTTICFTTLTEAFDVCRQRIVDNSGRDVTELSGGDSVSLDVTLTNTSLEEKSGVILLAVFENNKMVGYSITPFAIDPGTVGETVSTQTATIDPGAGGELTVCRYIWNSVENMDTLLKQQDVYLK